jgi:hypothetical protein
MSFLYAFSGYANEAAAKTALAEFVVGSTWRTDKVVPNITITDKTGFCCSVTVPAARDDLYSIAECQFEFNLKAKVVNRTKIPARTIETTMLGRGPQGSVYHTWRTNGLVHSRPQGDPTAWPYMTVNKPEDHLHPNSANFTTTLLGMLGEAPFAVNGIGGFYGGGPSNGGGSYALPTYAAEYDTPLFDITPSNGDPHPLYGGAAGVEFETEICNDVPIPAGATQAGGTDRQMGFYNPFTDTSWQFWIYRTEPYRANRGGRRVGTRTWNCRYEPNTWGVAATALPMEQHLPTVDEFEHGPGYAPRAITLVLIRAYAAISPWPAGRTDGATSPTTTPEQIPEGIRGRLKASVDLDAIGGLHPIMKFLGKTMQVHGCVVTDRGGSISTAVENEKPYLLQGLDERWPGHLGTTPFYEIDANFPWEDMEWMHIDFGKPTFSPGHIPGLIFWFSAQDVTKLITQSGQSFVPMSGAYDLSANACELRVVNTATSPDFWSTGIGGNKNSPRYTRANDERMLTTGARRLRYGADCTEMSAAVVLSARTALSANARVMSARANGQTNDDDNDGSWYFGLNAAGTHWIWKNNGVEVTLGAAALNTDTILMIRCNGTEAQGFMGTVAGGWVAGTPVACTSTFGDASGNADVTTGNIYQGGQGFEGAGPMGAIWTSEATDDHITAMRAEYFNHWVAT